jgi:ankyrin repeat protein
MHLAIWLSTHAGWLIIPTVNFCPWPGAKVDVCDADGNTALHVALEVQEAGTSDVVTELLAAMQRNKAPNKKRRASSYSDVIPGR